MTHSIFYSAHFKIYNKQNFKKMNNGFVSKKQKIFYVFAKLRLTKLSTKNGSVVNNTVYIGIKLAGQQLTIPVTGHSGCT